MSYDVRLSNTAQRDLTHLPADLLRRVDAKLISLSRNPRPRGCMKLRGREGEGVRVRVGDHRILYTVDDEARTVAVYRISPRGSAYR